MVLGGSTVTNTGPSVLNGDLGVAPGTALVGFGLPATVNGATHDNDGVANTRSPTSPPPITRRPASPRAPTLTGTNLGNRDLNAGTYRYASSAQLTGALTLDAQGDPNAQFVFQIGSTLTTASASSVVLVNGASPCNVFWQIGSSATLGTTTAFQGNLMALTSISVNDGVTVQGRLLARNGAVSLINDVIDGSMCGTSTSARTDADRHARHRRPGRPDDARAAAPRPRPSSQSTTPTRAGTARLRRPPRVTRSRRPGPACTAGFHATVTGHMIKRVVFSLDGKRIGIRTRPAFRQYVRASAGRRHTITARVAFKDATRSKTLRFRYRACAAPVLRPRQGPSQFTG